MILLKLLVSLLILKLIWIGIKPSIGWAYVALAETYSDTDPKGLACLEKACSYNMDFEYLSVLLNLYIKNRKFEKAMDTFFYCKLNYSGIVQLASIYSSGALIHGCIGALDDSLKYIRRATTYRAREDVVLITEQRQIIETAKFALKSRKQLMEGK